MKNPTYIDFSGRRLFWVNFNEGGRFNFQWKGRSFYLALTLGNGRWFRIIQGPMFAPHRFGVYRSTVEAPFG